MLSFLAALAFAVSAQAADAPDYKTLSSLRSKIQLPAYTPEQKQLVAEQAELVLREFYVNRERKIEFYGIANDPLPAAARLVEEARFLSDEELHGRLERIFQSQHDLHLSYVFPEPFACYRVMLPFSVDQAVNARGEHVIAVRSVVKDEGVLAVAPATAEINVGDVLLTFDDVPALDAARELEPLGGGSNAAGRLRRALQLMTWNSPRQHLLPKTDVVRLRFLSRQGEEYAVEMPWIAYGIESCLHPSSDGEGQGRPGAKFDGVDENQLEFERFYKPMKRSSEFEAITDTEEPTLHWDVVDNEFGRFAYLRLDSFVPQVLSIGETVALVKRLLENQLARTDGLIFDLRDNGGGMITYGESLVQLFTPTYLVPQRFRLLNSPLNHDFLTTVPTFDPPFRDALDVARTIGASYTEPLPFATPAMINDLGQSYFKPVAVLTNSACYSTCDMTTAAMQDWGVATIYGEDAATGGGGANNMSVANVLSYLPTDSTTLRALPAKQGIGFAWRQTVRGGKHDGELLEETGAAADVIVKPTLADFFTQSAQQFRQITRDLNEQGRERKSWYKFLVPGRADVLAGAPVRFGMKVSATTAVEFRSGGQTTGFQVVNAPATRDGVSLEATLPETPAVGTLGTSEIVGYLQGQRVWRAVQSFRVVPAPLALADGGRVALDFATADVAPLVVFTQGTPEQGWSVVDGKLKTGAGEHYEDNVVTEASLFLDLSQRTAPVSLSFDLAGKTELDYDFFAVSVVANGVLTDILPKVSGEFPAERKTFDLSPYLGKRIEIRVGFASDGGLTEPGVTIDDLVVE